jgi:moderate conductance mechanosensitive channel
MTWEDLRSPLFSSLLIILFTALGVTVTQFLQRRIRHLVNAVERLREGRRKQILTLIDTVRWIVDALIVGSALLMLLSTLGVNVTPMLASVGVAGLALSLGAQTLIKDIIGGVFILVENLYAVEDIIKVGAVSGVVERITLRSTHIRDTMGSLHMIPNGDVRVVSNLTRDWSLARVDIDLDASENLERAIRTFEILATEFAGDREIAPHLTSSPEVIGPTSLKSSVVTLHISVRTEPGKQWDVSRALQRRILINRDPEELKMHRVAMSVPGSDLT